MIVKCEYCGEEYELSENGGVCPHCGGSYTSNNEKNINDKNEKDETYALRSFDESGIDKRVLGIKYDCAYGGVIDDDSEIIVSYKKGYAQLSNDSKATLLYDIDFMGAFIIIDFPYSCRFILVGDGKTINWDSQKRRWEGLSKEELNVICEAKDLTFKYSKEGILHTYKDENGEFKLLSQVFYHTFVDKNKYQNTINQLIGHSQIKEVQHGLSKTFYILLVISIICVLLFFIL